MNKKHLIPVLGLFVVAIIVGGYSALASSSEPSEGTSLTASETWIANGASTWLTWSSPGRSCSSPDFDAQDSDSGRVSVSPPPDQLTTYTIQCGTKSAQATIRTTAEGPPSPLSVTLTSNPVSVVRGNTAALTWSSTADTCTGTYFDTGGAPSGTVSVNPASQGAAYAFYSVSCTRNSDGATAGKSVQVNVTEPLFDASCSPSTSSVSTGQNVTWNASAWNGLAPYAYEWVGQALAGHTGSSATVSYDTSGTKESSIHVTDSSTLGAGMDTQSYDSQRCTGPAITGVINSDVEDGGNDTDMQSLAKIYAESPFREGSGNDPTYQSTYNAMAAHPENYCVEVTLKQSCNPAHNSFGAGGCPFSFKVVVHSGNGSRDLDSGDFGSPIPDPGGGNWNQTRHYTVGKGVINSGVPQEVTRSCTVPVTVAANAPAATLSANPISVTQGSSSTLTHSCTNATSASIDQSVGAVTPTAPPGATVSVTPAATTVYTLTCTGSGGTATASVTVAVTALQPDLTAGSVSPSSATAGSGTSLSAPVSNSGSASTGIGFTDLFQRATDSSGSGAVDIGTYTSAVLGASGNNTASMSYSFPSQGTWYVRACADKSSAGSAGVITEADETNNCGPWTSVTVGPATSQPPTSCTVNNANPTVGATVTYTANGGTAPYSWTPSGGTGPGSSGNTTTRTYSVAGPYTMQVSGNGSSSITCDLVTAGALSCGTAHVTITATPNRVRAGQTSTISWTASGVDSSCTISGPGVSQSINGASCVIPNGSATPTITQQSVYTISCDGGETTAQAVVNLIPKFIEF